MTGDEQKSFFAPISPPAAPPPWGASYPAPPPPPAAPVAAPWGTGPGPAYGPGYGYQPPPARRGMNGWLIAAIVAAVVIVGAVVAAVTLFVSNSNGARTEANHYLAALQSGQYSQAYSMLCPADQAYAPESVFAQAKAADHPVSYAIHGTSLQTTGGPELAYVYYQEQRSDGWSGMADLPVVKSGGSWQICHTTVGDDGALVGG